MSYRRLLGSRSPSSAPAAGSRATPTASPSPSTAPLLADLAVVTLVADHGPLDVTFRPDAPRGIPPSLPGPADARFGTTPACSSPTWLTSSPPKKPPAAPKTSAVHAPLVRLVQLTQEAHPLLPAEAITPGVSMATERRLSSS